MGNMITVDRLMALHYGLDALYMTVFFMHRVLLDTSCLPPAPSASRRSISRLDIAIPPSLIRARDEYGLSVLAYQINFLKRSIPDNASTVRRSCVQRKASFPLAASPRRS